MTGGSFKSANAVGSKGEAVIAAAHGGQLQDARADYDVWLPRLSLRRVMPPGFDWGHMTGLAVEVKTESRSHLATASAFVERWTVRPDGSRITGGLWRAARDGVDAVVYYYAGSGYALWLFDLPRLCKLLDGRMGNDRAKLNVGWRKVRITNPNGYGALGRLIPRAELLLLSDGACREETYDA